MDDVLRGHGGTRLTWAELPARTRRTIESMLGAPVVDAASQPGGFSPGLASRVRLADGRRAFVKAVSSDRNRDASRLYRREADVLRALPVELPVPRLLDYHDNGRWVVLILQDIEGRPPLLPWRCDELRRVLLAMDKLATRLTPSPISAKPVENVMERAFSQWREFAERGYDSAEIPRWAKENLDRLVEWESQWSTAASGSTLLHFDARADNTLLVDNIDDNSAENGVVFVDWPHACIGAHWIDPLMMAPSVLMASENEPADVLTEFRVFDSIEPDHLNAMLAALSGYFLVSSTKPPPVNLPKLRPFQHAQGVATLTWLESRIEVEK